MNPKCERCGGKIVARFISSKNIECSYVKYDCIDCCEIKNISKDSLLASNGIINSFFAGHNAGLYILECNNLIIIGDDIRDVNPPPKGTIVVCNCSNYTVYIGPKIGGKRNEFYYFFKENFG